jgi:hypothetical protein
LQSSAEVTCGAPAHPGRPEDRLVLRLATLITAELVFGPRIEDQGGRAMLAVFQRGVPAPIGILTV